MVWVVHGKLYGMIKLTMLRQGPEVELEWLTKSDEVNEAYGWWTTRAKNAFFYDKL